MDDQTLPTSSPPDPICPWCSTALLADAATCPSCGAILTSDQEQDLPGVTAVDAKIARGQTRSASRSRLLSWISGEYPDDAPTEAEAKADAQALAPPDPEVQREILRLQLDAEVSRLQAEADAIRSDALVEGRVVDLPAVDLPDDDATPVTDDPAGGETPA